MAVPGEVMGYWAAKERFGNPLLKWAELIEPSIKMSRNGIVVTEALEDALSESKDEIIKDPGMK